MPQRAAMLNGGSPGAVGHSYFGNGWNTNRTRASTLQSIHSADSPSSPAYSSRESFSDNDLKVLDYIGIEHDPQASRGTAYKPESSMGRQGALYNPTIEKLMAQHSTSSANRFRSYSVNAKEQYDDGEDDAMAQLDQYAQTYGLSYSPSEDNIARVSELVRQHNLDVQAFANLTSQNRPRARTAGVLDQPSSRLLRNYLPTPSRLDNSMSAADLHEQDAEAYNNLTDAVERMHLQSNPAMDASAEGLLENPTRALWLGGIPTSTTVSSLNAIFGHFGPIESTRVLTHKSCAFVNFEKVEDAMAAKAQLNNTELFHGSVIRIGYAKVPSAAVTPGAAGAFPSPSPDPFAKDRANNTASPARGPGLKAGNINEETAAAALATPNIRDLQHEIHLIVGELGATPEEHQKIIAHVEQAISYDLYHTEIPPLPEPSHNRIHDAPRLREIRKRIDNNSCSQAEIEAIAMDMIPEVAELASDYLGNTVVQKLFEYCSEPVKEAMLVEIAPYLAQIGVHKNGTWAAQKIIDVAKTPAQMLMIVDALRPLAVGLFLDQYGNYVMQGCLRFQAPMNDFIFDVMVQRLWEVAQGRFGARAMRACLESHFATKEQQRMMAAVVALHSVQLATNANGALLLTWFLDTCTFPRRRSVLAPRLIPHLVHLCTHKVAYLTVLKIINQRSEIEARDAVLNALFFSPGESTLQDILSDQSCGATFIFKVLTTPFLDEKIRPDVLENVRNVLLRLKAQPQQGYKRLMDEVGLSTRHGGTPSSRGQSQTRADSRGAVNAQLPMLDTQGAFARQQYPGAPQQPEINAHMQGRGSMDSSFDPFGMVNGLMTPAYTHSPAMSTISPVTPQHIQYQQAVLAQQAAAANAAQQRPSNYYQPSPVPMNGFQSPAPQMMYGRDTPIQAPVLGMQAQLPNGFGPGPYSPATGYYQPMYCNGQQGQVGGQRRGRVSHTQSHVDP